jgi:plasmid stabilization system protein ParE
MDYRVIFLNRSVRDIEKIEVYIAKENPAAAPEYRDPTVRQLPNGFPSFASGMLRAASL